MQQLPSPAGKPANCTAPPQTHDKMAMLQQILDKYEVTIADVNDLVVLQDYEIVFVADDSGSMNAKVNATTTRWIELRETVRQVAEIACCLDADGIDLYFLNRPPVFNVTSADHRPFMDAFASRPTGSTPLTERVQQVVNEKAGCEKPVLVVIATDGQPNAGPAPFKRMLRSVLSNRSAGKFKFQILACTEDDDQVEWLNEFDDATDGIDVTDDYHSEKAEIMAAGRVRAFRRSDWVVKALLGPILKKYDELDKPMGRKRGLNDECACTIM